MFIGFVDGDKGKVIYGWAHNTDERHVPVKLHFVCEGIQIDEIVADRPRPDLEPEAS